MDLNLTIRDSDGEPDLSSFAGRIRYAMDRRQLGNQSELARAVGVKPQTIQYLLEPKNGAVGSKHTAALASYLGVSSKWLASGEGPIDAAAFANDPSWAPNIPADALPVDPTKYRRIWVIGKGSAGLAARIWNDGDYPVGMTDEYGEVASTDPHAFLTRVHGSSMIPVFNPGNFALVEPGTEPEIEDDVLVRLETGETMIKRLLSRRDGFRFGSYNDPTILHFERDEVTWVYYVAHPVPRRKIKSRN